ncbi:hypothetical protein CONPUDRAFT_61577 [Coniophora puteana RWD-64-598 SS2]|uniref:C2H2-type domain-containing protein n=1 Tax=Coniophora puteana (strain RWD-64-598) TaxID=741705 RepID=A0A5M3MFD7_CONPW|nr:uncharacterized protein CONPUDRAFT_61577 [Coniophora puteana RWD-64-598 SS2]EIW77640.1 hypothetical protein CONPUDRAFT_61577 [Coniophora puteana RWD-64-598 SS2]
MRANPSLPVSIGRKCGPDGEFVDVDAPPFPLPPRAPDDWAPFRDRIEFETADFLYRRTQAPAEHIDTLMDLWGATLQKYNAHPPFADHKDLYKTIDNIKAGEVPWESFAMSYKGPRPVGDVPPWMTTSYDVWFRDPRTIIKNILANPDFKGSMDYSPYREFDASGSRRWEDMFSGDWVWDQADKIAEDPTTAGSTFVPVILGSDKTTVSVATGHTEYYPLYLSVGNVHNTIRRAHRNAVALIGFLSIPKTNQSYTGDPEFRHFRRQLYHSSLSRILRSLKSGMTQYEVVRFGDGYFRRVIYGLGPYIADYPEQALLTCIVQGWCPRCLAFRDDLDGSDAVHPVLHRCKEHNELVINELDLGTLWDNYGIIGNTIPFTNDFPRADIHEMISPDILHQLVKGTFKDHLVEWVVTYLHKVHTKARALQILDDIDRRIAAVAPFAGLRRFPNGRGFKQWTGDDSKALMKVYIPAIEGHVPRDVVRTFRAFLEFCYLVRRDVITDETLLEIEDALERFHRYRAIFQTLGVANSISLPRQHSLKHYLFLIRQFGAPNGLCSSITESKHIKAVKEPWRRSSRFEALKQMLITNQRLDKLAAARVDFAARGMLQDAAISTALNRSLTRRNVEDEEGSAIDGRIEARVRLASSPARGRAHTIPALAGELKLPEFDLFYQVKCFLHEQLSPASEVDVTDVPLSRLPHFPRKSRIFVYNSSLATFRAPSDICGTGGMRSERIRSTLNWRNEAARHDCAFVSTDNSISGMLGMEVARVLAFIGFDYRSKYYRCALVHWFSRVQDARDEDTGMYMVAPDYNEDGTGLLGVVPVNSLVRAAHLIPFYGDKFIPEGAKHYNSYNDFFGFYVNRYADHHSFQIA